MASRAGSPGRTSFGDDPAGYDATRPPYPAALFNWLEAACGLAPGDDGFEIGAGTGLATLPVLALPVRSILAIEPDVRLAALLRTKAATAGIGPDRLAVVEQTFEDCNLPASGYRFGFAATSFHWIARGKGLAKVHDALAPGGWFAMWWSIYHDPERPDAFSAAAARLFDGLEEGSAKTAQRTEAPQKAFGLDIKARLGELRRAGFLDTRHAQFSETCEFTPNQIAALYGTLSRVRVAPTAARQHLLDGVARLAQDEFGGVVRREIITSAFIARKPAGQPD